MKALLALAGALMLLSIPPCALAQTGGSVMQGVVSAAQGAAQQAGQNAAGQVMQNMGLASPSPATSAASPSPAARRTPTGNQ